MAGGAKVPFAGAHGGGPLYAALPAGGQICALLLDCGGHVTEASPGCSGLFRREVSGLVGLRVGELFDGFELPGEESGSRDLLVAREGRPGHVRLFWSRRAGGATLLLADLEQLSIGGLSEAASIAHFVAETVHDLRNPLTSVKLIVQTLSRPRATPRAARQLTIALREVRAIERIVEALAGLICMPASLRPIALGPAVEEALVDTRRVFAERGLALLVRAQAAEMVVRGDKDRLALAFKQLVGGLAHGLEAGEVLVEVAASGQTAEVRLHALPNPSSRSSGMELSLTLVRKIANEHGGTMRETEGGFALALPLLSRDSG